MIGLRSSALALSVACAAWAGGCATPAPMIEPSFVARDQFGDNDPAASAALGQAVTNETVQAINQALRSRGYDVDLSARWDGIVASDGSLLVNRDEMGWLANGVLQFGNSPEAINGSG